MRRRIGCQALPPVLLAGSRRRGRQRRGVLRQGAGQRIGPGSGGRTARLLLFVDRIEPDRIRAHEERIALRAVVADDRRVAREQRIARLLPVLAVVAEDQRLVLRVVDLDVAAQDDVVAHAVEVDAVAPHLLLVGQHIAVARHHIERVGLVVLAPVGIEVVAVAVPDVRPLEEIGVVGRHVVDHRVAREFILLVAHLHLVDGHQLLRVGIVVSAHRLEQVVAVDQHAAVVEEADVRLRVEEERVGVERGVAVDDLHQVGIDAGDVLLAVVLGPVAVDVGRILVDEHVAEEVHAHVRIADGAVTRDDGAVVLRGEVAHEVDHRIARRDGGHDVGLEVDDLRLAFGRRGSWRLGAATGQQHAERGGHDRYGEQASHGLTSPSVCSQTPRCGTPGRSRCTWRRSSW